MLVLPQIATARQQAVAKHARDVAPEEAVLDEVFLPGHQHLLDLVRMVEEHGLGHAEAQTDDPA